MTTKIWIKLYIEMLDDPKVGRLSDHLWRCAVELILLAGKQNDDGVLPSVEEMAWLLRQSEEKVLEDLRSLAEVGIVHEVGARWVVTNFAQRQASLSDAERSHRYRERKMEDSVTKRDEIRHEGGVASSTSTSSSEPNSDSLEEGVQGEKPVEVPRGPAEAIVHPDVRVYQAVTGRIPGLGQYRSVVEAVRLMRAQKQLDDAGLAEYLGPYWRAWCGRKRQDGRPYDRGNVSWLTEWALNGSIPQEAKGSNASEVIREVARRKQ